MTEWLSSLGEENEKISKKDDFVNTAVNDSKQYTSHGLKSAIPRANTNKEGLYIESQEVEKTITKIHCARCGAILQNE